MFRAREFCRPLHMVVASIATVAATRKLSFANGDNTEGLESSSLKGKMPSLASMQKKLDSQKHVTTIDSLMLIGGTAHIALSDEISKLIKVPLSPADIKRFADGEVSVQLGSSPRGMHVFVVQSCAASVNDSIMELLLTVSTARRCGATRVTAVVPYFGYKHHRRGTPISTLHNSRFLSSAPMDFAKMLTAMGVDRVISVDLQRPGQGGEACFFEGSVPLETIITTDYMASSFLSVVPLKTPIVVVAPNSECVQKARKFQKKFMQQHGNDVNLTAFFHDDSGSGPTDVDTLRMLGHAKIEGADVVIVDDIVDTAGTLAVLSERLHNAGARNIYVCASHGLFNEHSMQKIRNSKVNKVVVTNTLPLPKVCDEKVHQVSIAPLLADVIMTEHFRSQVDDDMDVYQMDEGEASANESS